MNLRAANMTKEELKAEAMPATAPSRLENTMMGSLPHASAAQPRLGDPTMDPTKKSDCASAGRQSSSHTQSSWREAGGRESSFAD